MEFTLLCHCLQLQLLYPWPGLAYCLYRSSSRPVARLLLSGNVITTVSIARLSYGGWWRKVTPGKMGWLGWLADWIDDIRTSR